MFVHTMSFKCDDLYHTCTFEWGSDFRTHNSSLEGAMKLKFVPFCSSGDALSDGRFFSRNDNFRPENHGLYIIIQSMVSSIYMSLHTHISSLQVCP